MFEQIFVYLKRRDWTFEQLEEDTVITGFTMTLSDGNDHSFSIYVMLIEDPYDDKYIRLSIVPFVEQPYDGYPDKLYLMVGQVNHDLPGLKFAFDADGDLELLIDIPEVQLNQSAFDKALQLLIDYSGLYYLELSTLLAG